MEPLALWSQHFDLTPYAYCNAEAHQTTKIKTETFAQKIAGKYIPIHNKYWYFHASPPWWTVVTRLV